MKSLAKLLIFPLFLVSAGQILSMEGPEIVSQTSEGAVTAEERKEPESAATKKKKKKKKAAGNQDSQVPVVSMDIELYKKAIDSLLGNGKKTEVQDLQKLHWIANWLLFYGRMIESLKHISSFIPHLQETEKYRYIEGIFRDAFWFEHERGAIKECPRDALAIQSPEAIAAGLQICQLSRDRMTYSQQEAEMLHSLYQNAQEEVKKVYGFSKHKMYSYKLFGEIVFNLPHLVNSQRGQKVASLHDFWSNNPVLAESYDGEVVKFLNTIPYIDEGLKIAFNFTQELWNNIPEEDESHVRLTPNIHQQKKILDQFNKQIRPVMALCSELYTYVHQKMKKIYEHSTNKKTLHVFLNRAQQLFIFSDNVENRLIKQIINFYGVWPLRLPETAQYLTGKELEEQQLEEKRQKPVAHKAKNPKKKKQQTKNCTDGDDQKLVATMESLKIEDTLVEDDAQEEVSDAPIASKETAVIAHQLPDATYDKRIHQWFDQNYIQDKSYNEILYHSSSLLVDYYLFLIGIAQQRVNNKTGKKTDTNYQLGGQITYHNGQKQLVVFHATKDQDGICYHRGIELKEKNSLFEEYFARNYWQVFYKEDFPALNTEIKPAIATALSDVEQVKSEDNLCVKIHDPRLGIEITLFKPSNTIH